MMTDTTLCIVMAEKLSLGHFFKDLTGQSKGIIQNRENKWVRADDYAFLLQRRQ